MGLEAKLQQSWKARMGGRAATSALAVGLLLIYSLAGSCGELKKQYWATSLTSTVDDGLLQGLYEAVARGETGWLDVDPKYPIPPMAPGINLILYHVGGNCYTGSDCDRFSSSEPTGDRWGDTERVIDLNDPAARKVVIEDLVTMVHQGDEIAPDGREIGYVAKNSPEEFKQALDQRLLEVSPLYQINENAKLSQRGMLDSESQLSQQIGRQYCIPVFLKTFGSDVAYTMIQEGQKVNVYVSEDMTTRMAQMPNISGAAWSVDEGRYHPTIFAQGSPVLQARRLGYEQAGTACDSCCSKRFQD
jgi:hypothetical protein